MLFAATKNLRVIRKCVIALEFFVWLKTWVSMVKRGPIYK